MPEEKSCHTYCETIAVCFTMIIILLFSYVLKIHPCFAEKLFWQVLGLWALLSLVLKMSH